VFFDLAIFRGQESFCMARFWVLGLREEIGFFSNQAGITQLVKALEIESVISLDS